ncbi:MAG: hemolysin family protein [Lentisphaeria bacterium]|nr:hemolysin family protein [Lentisphaeria bacterium]
MGFVEQYFPLSGAILVLLFFSAFFSGSETALMSLSRAQVKRMSNGTAGEKAAYMLLREPQRLLAIVLVGNMFVNVLLTSFCASLLAGLVMGVGDSPGLYGVLLKPGLQGFGVQLSASGWDKLAEVFSVLLNILLLTPILIIFGELSPKTIAFSHNQHLSRISAFPLLYFGRLIAPLLFLLRMVSLLLQWLLRMRIRADAWSMLTPDEVAATFAAGEAGGATSVHERQLLERIMRFGRIEASDIMVPRTEIIGVSDEQTIQQAFQKLRGSTHNFLPVYHQDLDDIWGIIAFADYPLWLNSQQKDCKLLEFREALQSNRSDKLPVYPVSYVPPSARTDRMLSDMRKQSKRFTVVVGEYGGTLGIVTISSILEEIIGRYAVSGGNLNKMLPLPAGGWVVDGRARLRVIGKELNREFLCEADTVGGLIMEILGRVPAKGDRVTHSGLSLEVQQMAGNRVGAVFIRELPQVVERQGGGR